ncbi:hypothetical protein [Polaromonas sp. CG9_12]|nr:hypothetical protein [Polaromonas sp. CG9_12]
MEFSGLTCAGTGGSRPLSVRIRAHTALDRFFGFSGQVRRTFDWN